MIIFFECFSFNVISALFGLSLSRKNIYESIQNSGQLKYLRLGQRSVIKFLVAEKSKPCEIYRRMCDVYGEACFSQNIFPNELNCLLK